MIDTFAAARERMVTEQIERRGVRSPAVLHAFRTVPRHEFVPPEESADAYVDHPLAIGLGQTISQPYMVATMVEALDLPAGSKVLEIGTGSGYEAAILCVMGYAVFTIERHAELADRARARLERLGYRVEVRAADGTLGWPERAPFQGVVVSAAAPDLPIPLLQQLDEGGRLLIPVGTTDEQVLLRVTRRQGRLLREQLCRCRFVKLIGEHGWPNPA